MSDERSRLIANCERDIGPADDGYKYFWVKGRGAFSAHDLRLIADELDRRNKDWDALVRGLTNDDELWEELPELTDEERERMNGLGSDLVERLWKEELAKEEVDRRNNEGLTNDR